MKIHIDAKFNQGLEELGVIGFYGGEQRFALRLFGDLLPRLDCFFELTDVQTLIKKC